MARSGINKVILVGNLGQDPEVKYTAGGAAVTTLSLATSESWKDKDTGSDQERTEWHRVVYFGKLAEIVEKYLDKGSSVYIEGKLQTRKWQDKSGADRWTTEIVGSELTMLGSRQNNSSNDMAANQSESPFPQDEGGQGLTDDDIPF